MDSVEKTFTQIGFTLMLLTQWWRLHRFFLFGSYLSFALGSFCIILLLTFDNIQLSVLADVVLIISLISFFGGILARKRIKHHTAILGELKRKLEKEASTALTNI